MPQRRAPVKTPRKTPVQLRSQSTWDAVLEATIQVLTTLGCEALTTTKVAARAGVSVGTLYQYFPNKQALLFTVFEQHVEGVAQAVESACDESQGQPLALMLQALCTAFIDSKLKRAELALALRPVLAELGGDAHVRKRSERTGVAVARMLASASDLPRAPTATQVQVLISAILGVVDDALSRAADAASLRGLARELAVMGSAYLQAEPARAAPRGAVRSRSPRAAPA